MYTCGLLDFRRLMRKERFLNYDIIWKICNELLQSQADSNPLFHRGQTSSTKIWGGIEDFGKFFCNWASSDVNWYNKIVCEVNFWKQFFHCINFEKQFFVLPLGGPWPLLLPHLPVINQWLQPPAISTVDSPITIFPVIYL